MNESEKVESVIAPSLVVKGDIQSSGTLRIDGTVEGTISADGSIVVTKGGAAKGNITADNIVIGGAVEGNVIAREKVELRSTGVLHGDIITVVRGLAISEGAVFEGSCKMSKSTGQK